MENRRTWNRNTPSPSNYTSFSRSQRPHGQKFPSNATQNPKSGNFSERTTPSAGSAPNLVVESDLNSRKLSQDEDVDVQGPSYSGSVVGNCPYMCPGKIYYFKIWILVLAALKL